MTTIEQEIEELEVWAAGLEISASDPDSPYWMRRADAERATAIRQRHAELLSGIKPCAVEGCSNRVAGCDVCARCQEEIAAHPFSLRAWFGEGLERLFR